MTVCRVRPLESWVNLNTFPDPTSWGKFAGIFRISSTFSIELNLFRWIFEVLDFWPPWRNYKRHIFNGIRVIWVNTRVFPTSNVSWASDWGTSQKLYKSREHCTMWLLFNGLWQPKAGLKYKTRLMRVSRLRFGNDSVSFGMMWGAFGKKLTLFIFYLYWTVSNGVAANQRPMWVAFQETQSRNQLWDQRAQTPQFLSRPPSSH